jgi:NADH-quinone oxidoreductase subunit L
MALIFSLFAFLILFFFGRHLGKSAALIISIALSTISLFVCLYYFIGVFFYGNTIVYNLGSWICIGNLAITYKFIIDPLSISFATLISLITLLILIYSYDYLYYDPNLVKFFSYLNFFSFAMSLYLANDTQLVCKPKGRVYLKVDETSIIILNH